MSETDKRELQQQDEASPVDRYRALEIEWGRLIADQKYTSARAGEVMLEMDQLWPALTSAEQEACASRAASNATFIIAEPTSVICTLKVWLQNGADWLRVHPTITRVIITDLEPRYNAQGGPNVPHPYWYWWHEDVVPLKLETCYASGEWYKTKEAALDALSRAAIEWARKQR